jgi:hypothetical protein
LDFCISALQKAFAIGMPDIFNSDQGSQFTSLDFVSNPSAEFHGLAHRYLVRTNNIQIRMEQREGYR